MHHLLTGRVVASTTCSGYTTLMLQVVAVVGIIVALGFLFISGIHIYVYANLFIVGKRLQRKLAVKGRALPLKEAKQLLAQGRGVIIVDAPTLGWNVSRVWWAPPDAIIRKRPETWSKEKFRSDEDQVNYDNLIDESLGVAKVIDTFVFTQRVRAYIQRHFGVSDCPFVFTGGVLFEREYQRRLAAKKTARPPSSEGDLA